MPTIAGMDVHLGEMYRSARLRITDLVSDVIGDVRVAATPMWDVHDVIAHLSGVADDAVSGNMDGVTTDPWTAAQVERGRGRSIAEMLARWQDHGPMVEGFLSGPNGGRSSAAVIDIHTHECDLLTALDRPISVPVDVLGWLGESLREGFATQIASAGRPPVTVAVSDIELFRSRLGRRTLDEVRAYDWSADPEPYLDHWFVFGVADQGLGERVGR